MAKDQAIGALILVASIGLLLFYAYLYLAGGAFLGQPLWWWALVIPVTVGVVGILAILAWIGWTMATTPPPKPIEFEEPKAETSVTPEAPATAETAPGQEEKKA